MGAPCCGPLCCGPCAGPPCLIRSHTEGSLVQHLVCCFTFAHCLPPHTPKQTPLCSTALQPPLRKAAAQRIGARKGRDKKTFPAAPAPHLQQRGVGVGGDILPPAPKPAPLRLQALAGVQGGQQGVLHSTAACAACTAGTSGSGRVSRGQAGRGSRGLRACCHPLSTLACWLPGAVGRAPRAAGAARRRPPTLPSLLPLPSPPHPHLCAPPRNIFHLCPFHTWQVPLELLLPLV